MPSFRIFLWICRVLGWFTLLIAFLSPMWLHEETSKQLSGFAFMGGAMLVAIDFSLRMLADIEQHAFCSAQAMMELAQRGKRQPVEAKLVDPVQTNQDHQGKPRQGEPAATAPDPPASGPSPRR